MRKLKQGIIALLSVSAIATGSAYADQPISVDFFGESTFRGVFNGVEHDLRPTPTSATNVNLSWAADNDALAPSKPPAYNAPRRVAERLSAALGGVTVNRNNYAVSSTDSGFMLTGGTTPTGYRLLPFAAIGGKSESTVFCLNTGINDASRLFTVSAAWNNYRYILDRAIRTGHKVVMIQPNYTPDQTYAARLIAIFDGGTDPDTHAGIPPFSSYLSGLGGDFTRNVSFIGASSLGGTSYSGALANGGDKLHPSAQNYEKMASALAAGAQSALTDTANERKIAQEYVLFFNRAVEFDGGTYWLGKLKQYGEAYVAQSIYSAAPGYQGATPAQTVQQWYSNLFRQTPDQASVNYWVGRINAVGVGAAAVEMLTIVRNYGYNAGDINLTTNSPTTAAQATQKQLLVHRTNVGVAYGFRLRRPAVDTSNMMATITTDPITVYAAMQNK